MQLTFGLEFTRDPGPTIRYDRSLGGFTYPVTPALERFMYYRRREFFTWCDK